MQVLYEQIRLYTIGILSVEPKFLSEEEVRQTAEPTLIFAR